jgi:hypothetical protein
LTLAACVAETLTGFGYSVGGGQSCNIKHVELDEGAGTHPSCEIELAGIASILVTASRERVGEIRILVLPKPGIETWWSSEYVTVAYLPGGGQERLRVLNFAPMRALTDAQRARSTTRSEERLVSQSYYWMQVFFRTDSIELKLPDLQVPGGKVTIPTVRIDRSSRTIVLPIPFVRADAQPCCLPATLTDGSLEHNEFGPFRARSRVDRSSIVVRGNPSEAKRVSLTPPATSQRPAYSPTG